MWIIGLSYSVVQEQRARHACVLDPVYCIWYMVYGIWYMVYDMSVPAGTCSQHSNPVAGAQMKSVKDTSTAFDKARSLVTDTEVIAKYYVYKKQLS